MVYSFELRYEGSIYYESNEFTDTKEKAKSRLEEMSKCFLKEGIEGIGRLISLNSEKLKTVKKYKISLKEGNIVFE